MGSNACVSVSRRSLVTMGALASVLAPGLALASEASKASDAPEADSGAADGEGTSSGMEGLAAWAAQETVFRTVKSFSDDEADKPSDDDLETMMATATLASSTMGSQPWYFVAITGYDDQQAIAPSYTTHGTATILCCAPDDVLEALASIADDGTENMGLWKAFDLGDAAGYLCLAAMSLGYRVHIETSALHSDGADGQLTYDEIRATYVRGTYTPSGIGSDGTTQDAAEACANVVAAIHVGKPDAEVDAATGATSVARATNYVIWSQDLA